MKRNIKGITLIEVVLTVAIFSIIIASIYAVFFDGQNFSQRAQIRDLLRKVSDLQRYF